MPIHEKETCSGKCPFHNPSDHHMTEWPKVVRASALIERTCKHGVGHPDPDSVGYFIFKLGRKEGEAYSVHGCDGCCQDER